MKINYLNLMQREYEGLPGGVVNLCPTEKTVKIIDQVREITANEVAKKQDAAKLHFPAILELIKKEAAKGNSFLEVDENMINQYDQDLLHKEGFSVSLCDRPKKELDQWEAMRQYVYKSDKIWRITW